MLGTILGTGIPITAISAWVYRRQNRRLKDAEVALSEANVALSEANVAKAASDVKANEWHIWQEQTERLAQLNNDLTERNKQLVQMNAEKEDRHQADIKDWEERFTNQTTYLRGVQRDLIAANDREKKHIRREGLLERRIAYLLTWICKKGDCDHGEPPRDRLRGRRFDESAACDMEALEAVVTDSAKEGKEVRHG